MSTSSGIPSLASPKPELALGSVCLGISWAAVLLRLYTRIAIVKRFYAEDWAIIFSALLFTVYNWATMETAILIDNGQGKTVGLDTVLKAVKTFLISSTFYIWSTLALKISVGLFFHRLLAQSKHNRWKKIVIWTDLAALTLVTIATTFYDLLQCGWWTSTLQLAIKKESGKCASNTASLAVGYGSATFVAVTDLIFAVMPYFILKTSTIRSRRERVIVNGLMMFASISVIAAFVRFKYIPTLVSQATDLFAATKDVSMWSTIEIAVGITAACLACLRPLLRRHIAFFSRQVSTFANSRASSNLTPVSEVDSSKGDKDNDLFTENCDVVLRRLEEAHIKPSPVDLDAKDWPCSAGGRTPTDSDMERGLTVRLSEFEFTLDPLDLFDNKESLDFERN